MLMLLFSLGTSLLTVPVSAFGPRSASSLAAATHATPCMLTHVHAHACVRGLAAVGHVNGRDGVVEWRCTALHCTALHCAALPARRSAGAHSPSRPAAPALRRPLLLLLLFPAS